MECRHDLNWWRDCYEYALGKASENDEEFLEELLSVANDAGWEFAGLMEHAIAQELPFPVIVEIEPHQDDKGRNYLLVNAVEAKTLISLTANPECCLITRGYPVDEITTLDDLNLLLYDICDELHDSYRIRVLSLGRVGERANSERRCD